MQVRISIGLLTVGFIIRYFLYSFVKIPWIIYDEYIYLDTARQILHGSFSTHLTLEGQSYPPGWSLLLAAVVGFISNPMWQYRVAVLFTMLLSSLIPVIAYWYFKRLVPSLLLLVFAPLVVYAGSIMSETIYTLLLFVLLYTVRTIIVHDLKTPRDRLLSATVTGFILWYMGIIRSFAIVVPLAFFAAMFVMLLLLWQDRRRTQLLQYALSTALVFIVLSALSSLLIPSPARLYEISPYQAGFIRLVSMPFLTLRLMGTQITALLLQTFWFAPIFALWGTYHALQRRDNQADGLVRLFVLFLVAASFGLTLLHMAKDAYQDRHYLIFTRYLDPALIVLFAYGVSDAITYMKSAHTRHLRTKAFAAIAAVLLFALFYVIFRLYHESYKFGNTMAIYYLVGLKDTYIWQFAAPTAALVVLALLFWWRRWMNYFIIACMVLFVWHTSLSLMAAREVPLWIAGQYQTYADAWGTYMRRFPTTLSLCRMGGTIKHEVYYLYSFLYPYRYLDACDSPRDIISRRAIINERERSKLPKGSNCRAEYAFNSGDVVYYCPE